MNNTDKIIFAIVAVFTVVIFGLIIGSSLKNSKPALGAAEVIGENPNILGNADAKVVLVEFSDFECPACRTFYPFVEDVVEKYSNDMAFVYRHFPLPMHPRAIPTARASEAAAVQGKFWEYYAQLFDNFDEYSDEKLVEYAQNIGLDIEKFNNDLNSDEVVKAVNGDTQAGNDLNVQGTPSFFLVVNNEVRPVYINQYGDLEEAVKNAINEVNQN